MVAAEYMALDPSIKIAELVAKEKEDYNYIYPVVRVRFHFPNHHDIGYADVPSVWRIIE